jgi:hypothetical protein
MESCCSPVQTTVEQGGNLEEELSHLVDEESPQGRQTSPENRREVIIDLTPSGQELVQDVMRRRRREIRRILRNVSNQDRHRIAVGLSAFADAAGESEPEGLLTLGL